jgi:hypothetical protein
MLRLIPLVLATACVSEPASKSPVFVDPEDTIDDPYETQDTAEHSPGGSGAIRPLCQQPSVNATIAADIRAWIDHTQAGENRLYGDARSVLLEAMGENNLGERLPEIVENRMERGWQRARLGDIDGAIADLQRAVELTEDSEAEFQQRARHLLAMVWMRKAELDNCVTDQTGKACLIPFDPEGQHLLTLGMTEAARVWRDLLTENAPMEPVPRYMLNICHMALGDWPDAVEPQWRMGPELLAPEEVMPVWHNVAPDLGLAEPMLAGNAGMEDFDGDGLLDLITSSAELDVSMRLYLANGDGTFCDATPASGLGVAVGGLDFWPADYDNDGDMDVLRHPRGVDERRRHRAHEPDAERRHRGASSTWRWRPASPIRDRSLAGRGLVRLSTATAGSTCSSGASRSPPRPATRTGAVQHVPEPGRRHLRRSGPRKPGDQHGRLREGRGLRRHGQRRRPRPLRQRDGRRQPPVPQRS